MCIPIVLLAATVATGQGVVRPAGYAAGYRLAGPAKITPSADIAQARPELQGSSGVLGNIATAASTGIAGYTGDNGQATSAQLSDPFAVAFDGNGNLYITDVLNNVVRKVTPAGVISTVAGNGTRGYAGDGGLATSAELNEPTGVAVGSNGDVFISDFWNSRIRKVTSAGIITTVVGNGTRGYGGDGGPATSGELYYPYEIALDAVGDLYIADEGNSRIRMVSPAGILTTVAGNGTQGFSGDGGQAVNGGLFFPQGVAVDASGDLYIADLYNFRVRKVTPAGIISTAVGTGTSGHAGDGGLASNAQIGYPRGVTLDGAGNLYVSDSSNALIHRVTSAGIISTVVGNGFTTYSGDGGPAITAGLSPFGITVEPGGSFFIADFSNNRIRKVTYNLDSTTATPVFVPGGGSFSAAQSVIVSDATVGASIYYRLNGTTPTSASPRYSLPIAVSTTQTIKAIAIDAGGVQSSVASSIYAIGSATTTLLTSSATPVTTGQSVTFTATVKAPGMASTPAGMVSFTLDGVPLGTSAVNTGGQASYTASALTAGTHIVVAVYNGTSGFAPSTSATLAEVVTQPIAAMPTFSPASGTYTTAQLVSLADSTPGATINYTHDGPMPITAWTKYSTPIPVSSTEKITAMTTAPGYSKSASTYGSYVFSIPSGPGIITTVAGTGASSYSGEGGLAISARLNAPDGLAFDSYGNLYIADTYNYRVRKVTPAGSTSPIAGTGLPGSAGNGGPATQASLGYVTALAFDAAGNLYIVDYISNNVRKVTPSGTISMVAGGGTGSDGGLATSAALAQPQGVAVDSTGNLVISEGGLNKIRKVTAAGIISTLAETGVAGFSGDGGPGATAKLNNPSGLAGDAAGDLYVADTNNSRIRRLTLAGIITTVAGTGFAGFSGGGGSAISASLKTPFVVAVDPSGNLFIEDRSNYRLRKVTPAGIISTVAGSGSSSYTGDGCMALNAGFGDSYGIALDQAGDIFFPDAVNSVIREVEYGIQLAAVPAFSPVLGTYATGQTITLTSSTPNAAFYHTTDGTTPTSSSSRYTAPFTVSATTAIRAITSATGYAQSAINAVVYTITPADAPPAFSLASGTYTTTQTLMLTDATAGATIFYTIDGSVPSPTSSKYSGRLTIYSSATIKALAVAPGYANSPVMTRIYTISHPANEPLATISSTELWVTKASNTVYLFDGPTGKPLGTLTAPSDVLGISQNANNVFLLTRSAGAVFQAMRAGLFATLIPSVSTIRLDAARILVGPDGNLYITLANTNKVLRYMAAGASLGVFGDTPGIGSVGYLNGMAFGPSSLFVADFQGQKVIEYPLAGGSPATITPGCGGQVDSLAIGPNGDLYGSNRCNGSVYDIIKSTIYATGFRQVPRAIQFNKDGYL